MHPSCTFGSGRPGEPAQLWWLRVSWTFFPFSLKIPCWKPSVFSQSTEELFVEFNRERRVHAPEQKGFLCWEVVRGTVLALMLPADTQQGSHASQGPQLLKLHSKGQEDCDLWGHPLVPPPSGSIYSGVSPSPHFILFRSLSKLQETVKDREAWHAAVHGVAKSRTWPSDWTTRALLPISSGTPNFGPLVLSASGDSEHWDTEDRPSSGCSALWCDICSDSGEPERMCRRRTVVSAGLLSTRSCCSEDRLIQNLQLWSIPKPRLTSDVRDENEMLFSR